MVKLTISSGSRQKWRLDKRVVGQRTNCLTQKKFDQTNLKKPFTLESDDEH